MVLCFLFCIFSCKKEDNGTENNNDPTITGEEIPYSDFTALYNEIDSKIMADFQSGKSIQSIVNNVNEILKSSSLVTHVSAVSQNGIKQVSFQMANGMIAIIPFIKEDIKGATSPQEYPEVERAGPKLKDAVRYHQKERQSLTQVLPVQNPPCAVFATLSEFITTGGEKDFGPELSALAKKHGWDADYGNYGTEDKFGNKYMSVEFFKTLNEYSLVYLGSHGFWSNTIAGDDSFFLIQTDDTCNINMHNEFWENGDFLNQRVGTTNPWVYSGHDDTPNFIEHEGRHYAISHLFIDHYCSGFPDNSLVFLDMCMGMAGDLPMVEVLVSKNVAEVVGWTDLVHWAASAGVGKYLLTRMFGEIPDDLNGCITSGGTECYCTNKVKPPFRPFGFIETCEAIKEIGWHFDNCFPDSHGAFLMYYPVQGEENSPNNELNLVPSIYSMYYDFDVVTNEKLLTIRGNFGENKGKVTLGGKEVSCTWEDDEIEADLQGADGGGPIVVEYNGLKSNAHPLTAWEGSLKVTGNLGASQPEIEDCEVSFQFRTEIVDERSGPEDDPNPQYAYNGANIEGESKVTASMTGGFEFLDCFYNFDIPYNKGKMINVGIGEEENFVGTIIIQDSKAKFSLAIAWGGKVEKTCPPDPPEIEDHWMAIPLIFETDINEDGTIPSNTIQIGGLTVEIESDIIPESPPTEDTQR